MVKWTDRLTQNALVTGVLAVWWFVRHRKDPAAVAPGQRLLAEGIVVCTFEDCEHQALFHGAEGCTFCGCRRGGHTFVYPRPKGVVVP